MWSSTRESQVRLCCLARWPCQSRAGECKAEVAGGVGTALLGGRGGQRFSSEPFADRAVYAGLEAVVSWGHSRATGNSDVQKQTGVSLKEAQQHLWLEGNEFQNKAVQIPARQVTVARGI